MDSFETLVRLNQLRARKSKDLSLKWIILSLCTCFLLLFGSFSYNWLNGSMSLALYHFARDSYPWQSMSSMHSVMNSFSGYGYDTYSGGLGAGFPMNNYRRHGMINSIGPFSGCFETYSRFDFFGFQCRLPTESFLKYRSRGSTALFLSEFFLILGSLIFTLATFGSCCGCFGRNRLIGLLQSASGVIYLLGIILFFGNLGDRITKMFCGVMTDTFYTGSCNFGIGLYVSIFGNISMFICSLIYLKSLNRPLRRKSMPDIERV